MNVQPFASSKEKSAALRSATKRLREAEFAAQQAAVWAAKVAAVAVDSAANELHDIQFTPVQKKLQRTEKWR